jgi:hypothetical protein
MKRPSTAKRCGTSITPCGKHNSIAIQSLPSIKLRTPFASNQVRHQPVIRYISFRFEVDQGSFAGPPVAGQAMSALLRKRPTTVSGPHVAKGHVWTAPSWQELSSRVQYWSVRPCVRPLSAVHVTAGHNALRGSGPGQKDAFDNALALVGCPDRRIDRLCITCCSPSQPSHHAGCPV